MMESDTRGSVNRTSFGQYFLLLFGLSFLDEQHVAQACQILGAVDHHLDECVITGNLPVCAPSFDDNLSALTDLCIIQFAVIKHNDPSNLVVEGAVLLLHYRG